MYARRLTFLINYLVLFVSCVYGYHSLALESTLSLAVVVIGVLLSILCLVAAAAIHGKLPKEHAKASDFDHLLTEGPYEYVRHPFYSTLIALNYTISLASLSVYSLITSTLLIPLWWYLARGEESDLIRTWGWDYLEYQRKTPMFVPRYRRKRG